MIGAAIAAPIRFVNVRGHPKIACRTELTAGELTVVTAAGGRGQQAVTHFTARLAMIATAVPVPTHSLPLRRQTLLAGIAAAANAAPAALAASGRGMADMAFEAKLHGDGFVVHPAVVDCCMHVAASLNMPADDGTPAALRVPSSVEAFCALEEVKIGTACASAALEGEDMTALSILMSSRTPCC